MKILPSILLGLNGRQLLCAATSIVLFFSSWAVASSKNLYLSTTRISEDLNNPAVNCIHVSNNGGLWIGTQDGLIMYDGSRYVTFDSHNPDPYWIPGSNVVDLEETANGVLFALTFSNGILKKTRNARSFQELVLPTKIEYHEINAIALVGKHYLLIAHRNGLLLYDSSLNVFSEIAQGEGTEEVTKLAVDIHNPFVFAAANKNSINIYLMESLNRKARLSHKINQEASALSFSMDGNLFVGSKDGRLTKFDSHFQRDAEILLSKAFSPINVIDILATDDGIYVATDNGLFYTNDNFTFADDISSINGGLSSLVINDLNQIKNSIWIGTLGGLHTVKRSSFDYLKLNSDKPDDVTSFAEGDPANLWIGTYDGLWLLPSDNSGPTKFAVPKSSTAMKDTKITALEYKHPILWVGYAGSGIESIDTRFNKVLRSTQSIYNNFFVNDILELDGDLLVATSNKGLKHFKIKDEFSLEIKQSLLENRNVTNLLRLSDKFLLLFSENFCFLYDIASGSYKPITLHFKNLRTAPILYSAKRDVSGRLWIGTKNHGLFYTDENPIYNEILQMETLSTDGFLGKFSVLGLEIDKQGNVWASTDLGILRTNQNASSIDYYQAQSTLNTNVYNLNSTISRKTGEVVFGGLRNITRFFPSKIPKLPSVSAPKLTEVWASNDSLFDMLSSDAIPITLHHDSFPIEFYFHTLEYNERTPTMYRYKLDNFDSEWVLSNQNRALYGKLGHGEYSFRVQASGQNGSWIGGSTSLQLTILPPPWKTWWAYTLYLIATAMALWIIHRVYHSFVVDRKAAELAYEMYLAEERANDDLQEQLDLQQGVIESANTHSKSTIALVSDIQRFTPHSPRRQEFRVQVLSDLEECLYYLAGEPVVDVYRLTELVFDRVRVETPEESKHIISINEVTRDMVDSDLAAKAALIIAELVLNATLHAFEGDSPAQFIHVKFSRSALGDEHGDYWTLRVSDNGSGFLTDTTPDPTAYSGLGLVAYLTEQLGGTLKCHNEEGATVSIQIPGAYSA